jgi:hypothetical protein
MQSISSVVVPLSCAPSVYIHNYVSFRHHMRSIRYISCSQPISLCTPWPASGNVIQLIHRGILSVGLPSYPRSHSRLVGTLCLFLYEIELSTDRMSDQDYHPKQTHWPANYSRKVEPRIDQPPLNQFPCSCAREQVFRIGGEPSRSQKHLSDVALREFGNLWID